MIKRKGNKNGRILLLGEGNFTFAQDLWKIVLESPPTHGIRGIVATSFDLRCELLEKYSTAEKTLSGLRASDQVVLFHGIDATKNLESQLGSACLGAEAFEHIVFNFPHLGYEDLKAHSSLIAHILHRAYELLSLCRPDASFYLSLAQSQAENWNLKEMASRNNMICYDEVPFCPLLWPTYELKRHHTGKSFGTRVQSCMHYCFRRKPTTLDVLDSASVNIDQSEETSLPSLPCESEGPRSGWNLFRYLLGTLDGQALSTDGGAVLQAIQSQSAECAASTSISKVELPANGKDRKRPEKKRKVDDLVRGSYTRVEAPPSDCSAADKVSDSAAGACATRPSLRLRESWECKECGRAFESEQGVKTHVYMQHVLAKADNPSGTRDAPKLLCDVCAKEMPNRDALYQHKIAKHSGQFQSIRPAWASAPSLRPPPSTAGEGSFECDICGISFSSDEQRASHLLGWQPVTASKSLRCSSCVRCFSDDRSLKQHMNYCSTSTEKFVSSV